MPTNEENNTLNTLKAVFYRANQKMVEIQNVEGQRITAVLFDACSDVLSSNATREMITEAHERGRKGKNDK